MTDKTKARDSLKAAADQASTEATNEVAEVVAQVEAGETETAPVVVTDPNVAYIEACVSYAEARHTEIVAGMAPGGSGFENPAEVANELVTLTTAMPALNSALAEAKVAGIRVVLTATCSELTHGKDIDMLITPETLDQASALVAIAAFVGKAGIPLPVRYYHKTDEAGACNMGLLVGDEATKRTRKPSTGNGTGKPRKTLQWTDGATTLVSKDLWLKIAPNVPQGWKDGHKGGLKQSAYGQLLQALAKESHPAIQGWKQVIEPTPTPEASPEPENEPATTEAS